MSVYKEFISRLTYDVPVVHRYKAGIVTQVYKEFALWVAQPWDGDTRIIDETNAHEFEVQP